MGSSKPSQYIKGWVEFYKLKFRVTPDVLIPRPESELLVDEVLNILRASVASREDSLKTIIDAGTGCGNIAISLAKNLNGHPKGVKIIATDISQKALKVAEQNANFHGVDKRIFFIQSNLLNSFNNQRSYRSLRSLQDDNLIIVANLPYIPSERIPYLDSSVKDFEPIIALDGGFDGFELYRKLFQQISQLRMHNPGLESNAQTGIGKLKLIVCEIDYTHGELAVNEALKYFPDAQVEVKTDFAHKQRILIIQMEVLPK